MTRLLHLGFAFNMNKKRFKVLDHPDALLIACIVVSTKLIYPFDGEDRVPVNYRDPSSLKMDWAKWREIMRDPDSESLERRDMHKVQPEDVWPMTDRKITDYLDWFEQTQIQASKDGALKITDFFPLQERRRRTSRRGLTEEDIDERLKITQGYLTSVAPSTAEWLLRAGQRHAVYTSVEDLTDSAKAFYSKAADLAGLSLTKLVRAVSSLERSIQRWANYEQKKAATSARDMSESEEQPA